MFTDVVSHMASVETCTVQMEERGTVRPGKDTDS
jgi:hypothetical protein